MELYPFSKQRYSSFIPSISNSRLSPKAEIIATSKAYYNTQEKKKKTFRISQKGIELLHSISMKIFTVFIIDEITLFISCKALTVLPSQVGRKPRTIFSMSGTEPLIAEGTKEA